MLVFLSSSYIFYILIDSFYIKSYSHFFNFLLINYRFFSSFNQHYSKLLYYKQFVLIKDDVEALT